LILLKVGLNNPGRTVITARSLLAVAELRGGGRVTLRMRQNGYAKTDTPKAILF
jgi:hypothetical protein